MNIPFLSFFKKKAAPEPVAAPVAPKPLEKSSSDRLSKTVMPNAMRNHPARDSSPVAPQAPAIEPATPTPVGPRTISFGSSTSAARSADLPPAVALALEPTVERVIALDLADVVRQMPGGMVRPLEMGEGNRRVLLKASELEKGMASGKPTVSVMAIYDQIPEIFTRTMSPSDASQVQLPFQKVLEQFSSLQVRSDQAREQAVPQVETPFLKVTIEDNTRFGTTMEPIQTGELPPVRLQAATAEALAAAEPEGMASDQFITSKVAATPFPLRFPAPAETNGQSNGNGNGSHASPPEKPSSAPARIPFQLSPVSPKGTDAPAPLRVPASSGPSVPTSLPAAAPTRIPFKIAAPSDETRPAAEPWLTKESFASEETASESEVAAIAPALPPAKAKGTNGRLEISLPLKPILLSLPPFQIAGDISRVPDEARVQLPFALIEPQLASGRVILKPEEFAAGMPEAFQDLFNSEEKAATVSLPLQEVLKNLPTESLRMRDDQIEQEQGEDFATPFSAKAEEDAKRFKVAGTPVAKTVAEPTPTPVVVPVLETVAPEQPRPAFKIVPPIESPKAPALAVAVAAEVTPASPSSRSALQVAFDTDDALDAKAVVAHVGKMAGVEACAIMFGDGLSLAGTLPEEYEAEGLCAMAPSFLQRVEGHMTETKLGTLSALTLSCSKGAITFFKHNNLCLAALHSKTELTSDVRDRLACAVQELSRKYSNPA